MHDLFEEYALLESEIAEREEKKKQLKPHILNMLIDKKDGKQETSLGNFSIVRGKSWKYPEWVTELEKKTKKTIASLNDEIKSAKSKAESTKEATYEETPTFQFRETKL